MTRRCSPASPLREPHLRRGRGRTARPSPCARQHAPRAATRATSGRAWPRAPPPPSPEPRPTRGGLRAPPPCAAPPRRRSRASPHDAPQPHPRGAPPRAPPCDDVGRAAQHPGAWVSGTVSASHATPAATRCATRRRQQLQRARHRADRVDAARCAAPGARLFQRLPSTSGRARARAASRARDGEAPRSTPSPPGGWPLPHPHPQRGRQLAPLSSSARGGQARPPRPPARAHSDTPACSPSATPPTAMGAALLRSTLLPPSASGSRRGVSSSGAHWAPQWWQRVCAVLRVASFGRVAEPPDDGRRARRGRDRAHRECEMVALSEGQRAGGARHRWRHGSAPAPRASQGQRPRAGCSRRRALRREPAGGEGRATPHTITLAASCCASVPSSQRRGSANARKVRSLCSSSRPPSRVAWVLALPGSHRP